MAERYQKASNWNDNKPGFMEINLVSHDGGSECGDFAQTLDMTDIYSGWTETRAVKNKTHKWVFEAIYGYLRLYTNHFQPVMKN